VDALNKLEYMKEAGLHRIDPMNGITNGKV
jgi:hypothetical protein